jgi:hypothetical protein
VKIACWNIQGLNELKCNDTIIHDFINKHDCTIFIETWLNENLHFKNNYTYCLLAEKSKRGRSKGGIVVTMKNNVRKGVKILESTGSHIVWLKFDKMFF